MNEYPCIGDWNEDVDGPEPVLTDADVDAILDSDAENYLASAEWEAANPGWDEPVPRLPFHVGPVRVVWREHGARFPEEIRLIA